MAKVLKHRQAGTLKETQKLEHWGNDRVWFIKNITTKGNSMNTTIQILHASYGDCIFLSHVDGENIFNLLIDGGPTGTFGQLYGYAKPLRLLIEELREKEQIIDLAVITHVDEDHIGGFLEAMSHDEYLPKIVKEFWFNSYTLISSLCNNTDAPSINNQVSGISDNETKTSITQGITLEQKLSKLNWFDKAIHNQLQPLMRSGMEFTILSPSPKTLQRLGKNWEKESSDSDKKTATKESDHQFPFSHFFDKDDFLSDRSVPNGSSIAFLLRIGEKNILLLADSYSGVVENKLRDLGYNHDNKLKCSIVKISHHGSKGNTSATLLSIISSEKYVISTDGSIFGHPDKKTIARILKANSENNIYFNYESVIKKILLPEDNLYANRLRVCDEKMVL